MQIVKEKDMKELANYFYNKYNLNKPNVEEWTNVSEEFKDEFILLWQEFCDTMKKGCVQVAIDYLYIINAINNKVSMNEVRRGDSLNKIYSIVIDEKNLNKMI